MTDSLGPLFDAGVASAWAVANREIDALKEEVAKLRQDRTDLLDSMFNRFREWRGLDVGETCSRCDGAGRKCYPDTATWHGGAGGQMITYDVCNKCWGSGDEKRPWKSWRVP